MHSGGLDIGGTKIEARLFAPDLSVLASRRIPTPRDLPGFVAALAAQIGWLRDRAAQPDLPVGIAIPGIPDPVSGRVTAANLPIDGENLPALLARAGGGVLPVVVDSMALALSEANGGAGDGARVVCGLVFGTGLGAGLCIDGALPPRHGGLAVEIGHTGLPARALARHDLPLWRCGCGRDGCLEAYLSGPALVRLAQWAGLAHTDAPALAQAAVGGDKAAQRVLAIWVDLAAECVDLLQLALAPEVVVLGGGLSNLPNIAPRLAQAHAARALPNTRAPAIRLARHGDASGARGAAIAARQAARAGG